MRVLIAPDSFGGTLSAHQAADAMAQGWRRGRPDDEVVCLPLSDGGGGLLDAVAAAIPAAVRHDCEVADARGHATAAQWLALPDGRALIESAQACGLERLSPEQRSPRLTTSYGVGQLIAASVQRGAAQVVVGLGGSASVDGGAGMATALGFRLRRADGNGVKVGGEYLIGLAHVDPGPWETPVTAIADVDAVLLGEHGAVSGFAAQKGATRDDLPVLEDALRCLADVVERDLPGGPWRDLAGAGAAGGLGFGIAAFLGGRLVGGSRTVAELVGLDRHVTGADVVVTGEGRLDSWSLRGKVPGAVAEVARRHGARVVAVVGQSTGDADAAFDSVHVLGPAGMNAPADHLVATAAAAAASLQA